MYTDTKVQSRFIYLNACLSLWISALSPEMMYLQDTSRPPCGKSSAKCSAPVITALILSPQARNEWHSFDIFLGTCPTAPTSPLSMSLRIYRVHFLALLSQLAKISPIVASRHCLYTWYPWTVEVTSSIVVAIFSLQQFWRDRNYPQLQHDPLIKRHQWGKIIFHLYLNATSGIVIICHFLR